MSSPPCQHSIHSRNAIRRGLNFDIVDGFHQPRCGLQNFCSGNSKWLIERWVTTMRPRLGESAGDMRLTRLTEPPKSWSRFPSHNREERNKNATDRDRVHPRDFAVKHMTSEGQIRWATDAPLDEAEQRARTLPRSFSTKFGGPGSFTLV